MGFFLERSVVRRCLVGFAVVVILMVIFSGIVLFHLLLRSVNILSFTILWSWIRLLGLGASFGMVGYPFSLELMVVPLGLLPLLRVLLIFWSAALRVSDGPDVWTDGSLVDEKSSGVSSAGAGCFTFRDRRLWSYWNWGHWDEGVRDDSVASACRGFCSVPGLCRLFKGLNFGASFLHFRQVIVFILGLIIWE